jgi:phage tail sheath protein FI
MAEVLLSPGVLTRENDQSFLTQQPVQAGACIVGPTAKGPITPTLVRSYSDYVNKFGNTITSGSQVFSYFTNYSAQNYFNNGGTTLLVGRVTPGSFLSATSSAVTAVDAGASPFVLETISKGELMNSDSPEGADNSLTSGSIDNLRWEIPVVNSASGEFSLLIRQGNDTLSEKTVLESYDGLSLDPKSPNFISKKIGNTQENIVTTADGTFIQLSGSFPNTSRYVVVKTVSRLTPDYLDNAGTFKPALTSSLPVVGSGSFGGASGSQFEDSEAANFYQDINSTNIQGVHPEDYNTMFTLLNNKDEYQFNLITAPGINREDHATQFNSLVNLAQGRTDTMAVADLVGYNSTIGTVTTQAGNVNNSYAASYWPWVLVNDPDTNEYVFVPASTVIPGVYAFNDAVAEPWFAPAGINRGGLDTVVRPEKKLTQANRDTLYQGKVNPIAVFPNTGTVVFGQKTLQKKASALDRVNVRRLLINLKSFIGQVASNLVFEQNTVGTRNNFLAQVNPFLESVQQRQGLFAFKVVMDDTNNTPDVIDRNQLVGQIFLQPTRTAEFIVLDFNVLPTGVEFPS